MTKTWNFVAKKIADGVYNFLSFFCLILIWCVCMIFSKISLVTSHGAFSARLDFTAGNTPCRKINQSTASIHSVPSGRIRLGRSERKYSLVRSFFNSTGPSHD